MAVNFPETLTSRVRGRTLATLSGLSREKLAAFTTLESEVMELLQTRGGDQSCETKQFQPHWSLLCGLVEKPDPINRIVNTWPAGRWPKTVVAACATPAGHYKRGRGGNSSAELDPAGGTLWALEGGGGASSSSPSRASKPCLSGGNCGDRLPH